MHESVIITHLQADHQTHRGPLVPIGVRWVSLLGQGPWPPCIPCPSFPTRLARSQPVVVDPPATAQLSSDQCPDAPYTLTAVTLDIGVHATAFSPSTHQVEVQRGSDTADCDASLKHKEASVALPYSLLKVTPPVSLQPHTPSTLQERCCTGNTSTTQPPGGFCSPATLPVPGRDRRRPGVRALSELT